MKSTYAVAGFLAATMALTATASAAQHMRGGFGGGTPASFAELDADGSGEVTLEEMQAHRTARLAAVDTNNDGALSKEELIAAAGERSGERLERGIDRMLERFDENEDGLLQITEMPQRGDSERAQERFEKVDTDGSGGLSEAELEAAKEARGERKGPRGGDKDRKRG